MGQKLSRLEDSLPPQSKPGSPLGQPLIDSPSSGELLRTGYRVLDDHSNTDSHLTF